MSNTNTLALDQKQEKNGAFLSSIWYVVSGQWIEDTLEDIVDNYRRGKLHDPKRIEAHKNQLLDHVVQNAFWWKPENINDDREIKKAFSEHLERRGIVSVTAEEMLERFRTYSEDRQNRILPKEVKPDLEANAGHLEI